MSTQSSEATKTSDDAMKNHLSSMLLTALVIIYTVSPLSQLAKMA